MKRPGSITYPKLVGPEELEPFYSHHVGAMTSEGLHYKQDIAFQLALRDKEIVELRQELADAWRNDHPVPLDRMIENLEQQLEHCRMLQTALRAPQPDTYVLADETEYGR